MVGEAFSRTAERCYGTTCVIVSAVVFVVLVILVLRLTTTTYPRPIHHQSTHHLTPITHH